MSKQDATLIADALNFLADGFRMASESGVDGELERVSESGEESPYSRGLPAGVRISCNGDRLQIGRFSARMPPGFLLESIGKGTNSATVVDRAGSVWLRTGMSARDGSETYRLSRSEISYTDLPDGFAMTVTMQLGEPDRKSFIYTSPADRSDEVYRASFQLAFADLFKFVFPVTKHHSEALISKISETFGSDVEPPSFYVSDRNA